MQIVDFIRFAHQTVPSPAMNGNNNAVRQHHIHSVDLTDKWLIGDLPNSAIHTLYSYLQSGLSGEKFGTGNRTQFCREKKPCHI